MESSGLTYKNFKFNWHVDDFHYNPGQILQSTTISIPPFSGVYWCLRLKFCDPGDIKSVECSLDRIPSEPGPDFIFIDFTLQVSGSTVCSRSHMFKDVQFLNVEPYTQGNQGLKLKLDVFKFPSRNAKLLVECVIHRKNVQQNYTTGFYHVNTQTLSENILALHENRYYTDVTLCIQRHVFLTHKAILDARIPLVASVLNINYHQQSEIEVYGIPPSLMSSLLHYAYSGSLIAGSFAELQRLHHLAGQLGLVDLQRLINTSSNNCVVRTTMNLQRKVFNWEMDPRMPWANGHDMIAIIIPHQIGSSQTLTISWGAIDTPFGQFLEFKFQFPNLSDESLEPVFMNCSFVVVREDTIYIRGKFHHLFSSRTPWYSGPVIGRSLLDNYKTLMTLRVKIDLCDGEGKTFIEESEAEIAFPLPLSKNLEKLSYDLKNLLNTGRFFDVTLVTDQHLEMRCHRAILAARSKTFLALLRQCSGNRIPVNGVSNEALLFVLRYIYSGKTKDLNLTNVREFNEAAKYFQIPALVSETHFFMEPAEQRPDNRFQAIV